MKYFGILIAFFVFAVSPAYAAYQEDVLSETTSTATINFPPVTAGTGHVLPDSPFYFVDNLFQKTKIFFAFTAERRALVYSQILGERLAELRVMMQRNNLSAIHEVLNAMDREARSSSYAIADARSQGKDIGATAEQINNTLQAYRNILGVVSVQSAAEVGLHIDAVRDSMLSAKLKVEDSLTGEIYKDAIATDFENEMDTQVLGAKIKADSLERRLNFFEKRASNSSELQEASKSANEKLDDKKRKLREEQKKKREALVKLQKERIAQTKEAIKKAREAAEKYKEAQEVERELRKED